MFTLPTLTARRARGFSLIDMLTATAIAAVVMSAALPSLQAHVQQSRRLDAVQALVALQLAQERWRADQATYSGTLQALGQRTTSAAGHYTLRIEHADTTGYTLVARAVSSAQRRDSACQEIVLTQVAGRVEQGSRDATGAPDVDRRHRCWVL